MNEAIDREGFAAFMLRLRGKGISDKLLIGAFESIPRRSFVPPQWQGVAWSDRMIPIECGEALEGADLQAEAIRRLDLNDGCRVLEIGTGSGFTAAVMARLAARVVTVERYRTLAEQARARIGSLQIANCAVRHADGSGGLAVEAPFDRIIVWAAFETLPRAFIEQLSSGGAMIAPIGPGEGEQTLAKLTKVGSRFERQDIAKVRLQPLVPGLAQAL